MRMRKNQSVAVLADVASLVLKSDALRHALLALLLVAVGWLTQKIASSTHDQGNTNDAVQIQVEGIVSTLDRIERQDSLILQELKNARR